MQELGLANQRHSMQTESGAEKVEDHSDTDGKIGQQGDQASQSERKSTLNIHWKD